MNDVADLLANIERPEDERPRRVEPPLPDIESSARPWLGSVHAHLEHWRQRAPRAEALVERLARQLARYRFRP